MKKILPILSRGGIENMLKKKKVKVLEKAREALRLLILVNTKFTLCIKPGYQEPTVFLLKASLLEKEVCFPIIFETPLSLDDIVEVVKMFQELSTTPLSVVVTPVDSNLKLYLQDAGINDVTVATEADFQAIELLAKKPKVLLPKEDFASMTEEDLQETLSTLVDAGLVSPNTTLDDVVIA